MKHISRFLLISPLFFFLTNCSSDCKEPNIVHLDFCDQLTVLPMAGNGELGTNLKYRTMYYLIDETNSRCFTNSVMKSFLDSNILVQNEIKQNYFRFEVLFYKKSGDIDNLLSTRSVKYLSYCNDDLIADYEWDKGINKGADFYKNGVIEGAENIKIENIKPNKDTLDQR